MAVTYKTFNYINFDIYSTHCTHFWMNLINVTYSGKFCNKKTFKNIYLWEINKNCKNFKYTQVIEFKFINIDYDLNTNKLFKENNKILCSI